MTSAPSLSVDLWHVVSLHVGSARALAAMVGVSKEWRAAVTNESWCRVTCMRFPRVVAIVTALELETPVYREVYREQLACTVPAATSLVAAALQSSRATTTCRHQKCIPFGHVYQITSKLYSPYLHTESPSATDDDGGFHACSIS